MISNNQLCTDKLLIANYINHFFTSQPSKLAPPGRGSAAIMDFGTSSQTCPTSLRLFPTNVKEVSNAIKSLNKKPSAGWDEISPTLIKDMADVVSRLLVLLFNETFETGFPPDRLQFSIVSPLNKKGDLELVKFPALLQLLQSPLSQICLTKIVLESILLLLDHYDVLNKYQRGFFKGKSTVTALHEFTIEVLQGFDGSRKIVRIFVIYHKRSFDYVDNDVLLSKNGSVWNKRRNNGIVQPLF